MAIDWEELLGDVDDFEAAWEELVYKAIDNETQLELDEEYVDGIWNGKNIRIKNSWGGHVFTELELTDLFEGKSIKFRHALKGNKEQYVVGKLDYQEYEGTKYIGFKPNWDKK